MKTKIYPLVVLILLCCVSLTSAQERVWGLKFQSVLYSTRLDGSDYQELHLDTETYGEHVQRLIKLFNGNLIFVTEYGGAYGNGTVSAITPEGIAVLYNI